MKVFGWISRNSEAIEAVAASVTALVAVAALIGVKFQIDATADLQQKQAAREIYREYLNISVQHPELAVTDYCALNNDADRSAYTHYVEYALYTAEQVIAADQDWFNPMVETLGSHATYLCSRDDWSSYTPAVETLIDQVKTSHCAKITPCGSN